MDIIILGAQSLTLHYTQETKKSLKPKTDIVWIVNISSVVGLVTVNTTMTERT
jgi:hypothetical protein